MNRYLLNAGLFLVCSILNLISLIQTGNGFSLILGLLWLAASAVSFLRYRKEKTNDSGEEKTA